MAQDKCDNYRGIEKNTFCCASSCGTCGGPDCRKRPGGGANCCTGQITAEQVCGVSGRMAPCRLPDGTNS